MVMYQLLNLLRHCNINIDYNLGPIEDLLEARNTYIRQEANPNNQLEHIQLRI